MPPSYQIGLAEWRKRRAQTRQGYRYRRRMDEAFRGNGREFRRFVKEMDERNKWRASRGDAPVDIESEWARY